MKRLMSTKEVAHLLGVNEKMVYTLISDKGLPATRVTGKWHFPERLVEEWIESRTVNLPQSEPNSSLSSAENGPLLIAGSNDLLLDRALSLYTELYPSHLPAFANLGSLGGLRALARGQCHIATAHLLHEGDHDYNFAFARQELPEFPAVINFAQRQQGFVVRPGNPSHIQTAADLVRSDITIVNRRPGTGTRALLEKELERFSISNESVSGFDTMVARHIDVGLEVLAGRADTGLAIESVAQGLGLDFVPVVRERYDLLIPKNRFFDQQVQLFLDMIRSEQFTQLASDMAGYNLELTGKMVYSAE